MIKEVFYQRLRNHIHTVVERYKDVVYAWDVLNEAIADGDGNRLPDDNGEPSPYRQSRLFKLCGEELVRKVFEFAHEADPDAKLFYNDYNAAVPSKRDRIYNMVKKMKDDGVPIDGIGMQGHYNAWWPSAEDVEAAISKYSEIVDDGARAGGSEIKTDSGDMYNTGAYLLASYDDGTWQAELSGRLDHYEQFGNHGTWPAGFGWRYSPLFRTSLRYGTSFRAPSIMNLYYPYMGNPELDPEKSGSWELLFEGAHKALDWKVTGYRTDYKDRIVYDSARNWLPYNIDKARVEGVEAELNLTTWLPLEYELNQTYAQDRVQFSEYLTQLRQLRRKQTREKIARG